MSSPNLLLNGKSYYEFMDEFREEMGVLDIVIEGARSIVEGEQDSCATGLVIEGHRIRKMFWELYDGKLELAKEK